MGATEQSASYFPFLTSYHEMLQFASCYDSQIPSILLMGPTRRFVAEWGMVSRMFEPRPWHKLMCFVSFIIQISVSQTFFCSRIPFGSEK